MSVKTTGKEFNAFYTDTTFWPEGKGIYHEDEIVTVNGVRSNDYDQIPDDSVVKIIGGRVINAAVGHPEPPLENYFKRGLRTQTHASFVVTVPKDSVGWMKDIVKMFGGKIA